jgi:hypothetical protein
MSNGNRRRSVLMIGENTKSIAEEIQSEKRAEHIRDAKGAIKDACTDEFIKYGDLDSFAITICRWCMHVPDLRTKKGMADFREHLKEHREAIAEEFDIW